MRAAAATRAVSVGGRPKMLREMPRPLYICHRVGGSTGFGPYPENTAESMEFLLLDGGRVMNYDGLSVTSDGVIVNEHDTTVDRTKNGTGSISAMTLAQYKALKQAPSISWGPGFPDNTWATHTFDEMTAQLGARAVHHPECNLSGFGPTYAASFTSRGLKDYVQVESGTLPVAQAILAAGIEVSYLPAASATVATLQSTWPATNGPVAIDYYNASPPGGSIDTYIQALVTAGYRVQVFSINRKSDAADAIASAAAAGGVLDGVISNDPIYMDTRIWTRRTTDSFSTGRYGHGLVVGSGGAVPRGIFTGTTPNRFGWTKAQPSVSTTVYFNHGEMSPLPGTFTLLGKMTNDAPSSAATGYMGVLFCATTDRNYGAASNKPDGYLFKIVTATGAMSLSRSAGGTGALTPIGTTGVGSNPIAKGQTVPIQVVVTATTVTVKRVDTNETITATSSTYRGPYLHWGKGSGAAASAFTDAVLASGSPTVTSATAAFNAATDVDKLISGTGIPTDTIIVSVESATSATMSANATASGTGRTINVSRGNAYATYSEISVI